MLVQKGDAFVYNTFQTRRSRRESSFCKSLCCGIKNVITSASKARSAAYAVILPAAGLTLYVGVNGCHDQSSGCTTGEMVGVVTAMIAGSVSLVGCVFDYVIPCLDIWDADQRELLILTDEAAVGIDLGNSDSSGSF